LNGEFTHLILTGSEASIMERDRWAEREIDFVREAVKKNIAILGSCYGHQLLAVALAGPEYVRRCRVPELGWLRISVPSENALLGPAGSFDSFTLHFDEVAPGHQGFRVLASTELCPIHAFRWKDRPFWGIQAHPEINVEEGRRLLADLMEMETPNRALFQRALERKPRDSGVIKQLIQSFLAGVYDD
jgi:GMP synthase-like glutamine amidotransferase